MNSHKQKTVVAAALGECVHVAGVMNFLRLAEAAGWQTVFLGPAVPVERVLEAARAEACGVTGRRFLPADPGDRRTAAGRVRRSRRRSARRQGCASRSAARRRWPSERPLIGFFERVFDGSEPTEEVLAYLRGRVSTQRPRPTIPQTTVERIAWKAPYPLMRHHFGLPTVEATRAGHRANRRRTRAGRDFAGHRPGCAGELLPPGATGPAAHGRRRRAGAQRR